MNFHELKLKLPTSSQSFAGLRNKGTKAKSMSTRLLMFTSLLPVIVPKS